MPALREELDREFLDLDQNYERRIQTVARRCFGTLSRWMPHERTDDRRPLSTESLLGALTIDVAVTDRELFGREHFAAVLAKILPAPTGPHPRSPVRKVVIGSVDGQRYVGWEGDTIFIDPMFGSMKAAPAFLLTLRRCFFKYIESIVTTDLDQERILAQRQGMEIDQWTMPAAAALKRFGASLIGLLPTCTHSQGYWSARELLTKRPKRPETMVGELAAIATSHVFGYADTQGVSGRENSADRPLADRWHSRLIAMQYLRALASEPA